MWPNVFLLHFLSLSFLLAWFGILIRLQFPHPLTKPQIAIYGVMKKFSEEFNCSAANTEVRF